MRPSPITTTRLVLRGLRHYWRSNVAVAFGIAIATAVITGSLIIGDSVKGSIRDAALDRLGRVDQALVAPSFFDAGLAEALVAGPGRAGSSSTPHPRPPLPAYTWRGGPDAPDAARNLIAPLILTQGVLAVDETGATVPNVTVVGVDDRFASFWPASFPALAEGHAAVNERTARDLRLAKGSSLLLTVAKPGIAPSDSLFARHKRADVVRVLRISEVAVLPDKGAGGFGLDAATTSRRNVFVDREWLAEAFGKPGKANALAAAGPEDLDAALARSFRLEDAGLKLVGHGNRCDLHSDRLVLSEQELDAAEQCGSDFDGQRISMSLATRMNVIGRADEHEAAYTVVGARDGSWALEKSPGGIAIREWLKDDLQAKLGDRIQAEFLSPKSDGTYATVKRTFTVRRIDPTFFADPTLVPEVEGLTDAPHMGDWDPPFPVDLSRITPRDEQYWDRYRAAPKAFISIADMRALWGDKGGYVTSYRFFAPASVVKPALMKCLDPLELGLRFRPVRKLALDAAEGSTEYSGLFLGLGIFIIASAVGLASTLMQLACARRSAQWGVMAACGVPPRRISAIAQLEGLAIVAVGAFVGGGLGVGYAVALVAGLTRWWVGAIGTAPLWLHVQAPSVAAGVLVGLCVGYAAVALGIRGLLKRPASDLAAGPQAGGRLGSGTVSRWKPALLVGLLAVCGGMLLLYASKTIPPQAAFSTTGMGMLLATLLGCDLRLSGAPAAGKPTLARIAGRNAALSKRHSLLVVALLAAGSFTLFAVAPNVQRVSAAETSRKDSGSGGFGLVATASVPLPGDLASPAGRATLGFSPADEATFKGVEIVPLLMQPGEDASCLNLAKPTHPSILAASPQLVRRGGFALRTADGKGWGELESQWPGAPTPAFGDSETVTWILHSHLGALFTFEGGAVPLTVRFAGLVEKSIFAGDVLIPEREFRRLFPSNDSPRVFLIATPPGREAKVADALRRNLGDLGLDVRSTSEILSGFLGVQNAYISTFLALGALGLLLGTVGLATVLAREAFDRRKEFALMLACGLTRGQIAETLVLENGGLLVVGVAAGAVSALVATGPVAFGGGTQVDWPLLASVSVSILAVGLGLCVWAARAASRGPLIPALRSE